MGNEREAFQEMRMANREKESNGEMENSIVMQWMVVNEEMKE